MGARFEAMPPDGLAIVEKGNDASPGMSDRTIEFESVPRTLEHAHPIACIAPLTDGATWPGMLDASL